MLFYTCYLDVNLFMVAIIKKMCVHLCNMYIYFHVSFIYVVVLIFVVSWL